jgi:hypothetical protein
MHPMKFTVKSCLILWVSLLGMKYAVAGAQSFALPNAYAHNDYWHKRPLFDALSNGFTYFEADVFLHNGRLIVAHMNPWFKKRRTLEKLYLAPLAHYLQSKVQTGMDTLVLMIDIKSESEKTFLALERLLQKYKHILSSCENGQQVKRNLTIILTGHRPLALLKSKQCRLFYVDDNLQKADNDPGYSDMYATTSCKYSKLINWKGDGVMPAGDKKRLCELVTKAHSSGKKVRLWASPEKENVWQELLRCGVDLINTNKLVALRRFFMAEAASMATNTY